MVSTMSRIVVFSVCYLYAAVFAAPQVRKSATEGKPGFVGKITQAGLDYANTVGVDIMMEQLKKSQIPNVQERINGAQVTISNIQITSFPRPNSRIRTIPNRGVRLEFTNMSPTMNAKYQSVYSMWFVKIKNEGSVIVTGKNMFLKLEFAIGPDRNGHPNAWTMQCQAGGDLSLKFEGDWSSVLNLGSSIFKSKIKEFMSEQLCSNAKKEIEKNMQDELLTFPVTETIEEDYEINFGFVKFPSYQNDNIVTYHNGTTYLKRNSTPTLFTPVNIPAFPEHREKMVYMYVTDYVINSGLYAAFLNKNFSFHIAQDMLPEDGKGYMQASCPLAICVGTVVPEIAIRYPGWNVEIDINATRSPVISVHGDHVHLEAHANAQLHVRQGRNSQRVLALEANITLTGKTQVKVNDSHVTFEVKELSPSLKLLGNDPLGALFDTVIEAALRLATQQYILPKLRELGRHGLMLPSIEYVQFVNPEIMDVQQKGYIVIGTDLQYLPPPNGLLFPL